MIFFAIRIKLQEIFIGRTAANRDWKQIKRYEGATRLVTGLTTGFQLAPLGLPGLVDISMTAYRLLLSIWLFSLLNLSVSISSRNEHRRKSFTLAIQQTMAMTCLHSVCLHIRFNRIFMLSELS